MTELQDDSRFAFTVNGRWCEFPSPHYPNLRDQFAVAALPFALADEPVGGELCKKYLPPHLQRVAARAYQIADAMLAERAK